MPCFGVTADLVCRVVTPVRYRGHAGHMHGALCPQCPLSPALEAVNEPCYRAGGRFCSRLPVLVVKNLPACAGDMKVMWLISGSGRPLEEDAAAQSSVPAWGAPWRGAREAAVLGVAESDATERQALLFVSILHFCQQQSRVRPVVVL